MRKSKLFGENFISKRARVYTNLSRNLLRIPTGFLTSHCGLRKDLMRIGLDNENDCRFCKKEEESPLHLQLECEALASRKLCYQTEESDLDEVL